MTILEGKQEIFMHGKVFCKHKDSHRILGWTKFSRWNLSLWLLQATIPLALEWMVNSSVSMIGKKYRIRNKIKRNSRNKKSTLMMAKLNFEYPL